MLNIHAPSTGWALTGIFALFIAGASVTPKLLLMPEATETLEALGWSADDTLMIGSIELACLVLYL
ncbi:hypothetical protein [Pseudooceanicola algae]|uniref:Uncharacterized protein n=1 Tax=Pseudooceanicola algae TaxID=1537215 RepID=A0A418SK55_9RHOB|nr:hypothetical protein [Pseudooceanicola algae]QPM92166.1 hypothetical protein PSAL_034300 [Pseudooceanicola algae]